MELRLLQTKNYVDDAGITLQGEIDKLGEHSQSLEASISLGVEKRFKKEKAKLGIVAHTNDELVIERGK